MDDKTAFSVGALLLTAVIIETMFLGNTFGLQWHSPKLMYQLSVFLVPIKLVISVVAVYFLWGLLLTGWRRYTRYALLILGGLHISLLSLGCILYLLLGFAPLTNQYQQNGNVSVYTANPGAMGKAYHYFSYICHSPLDFYTVEPIAKLDWLGKFKFTEQDAELIIEHTDYYGDHETRISLAGYRCE